ncbi:putative leader peptide [Geodermatophilus sp. URMC 64]
MHRTVLASRRHVDLLRTASAQCRAPRSLRRSRRHDPETVPACPFPPVPD